MAMRGSVTRWVRKEGYGFVLGEDGCEVYFDEASLDGFNGRGLSVGDWVEYEVQFGGARTRAVNVRPVVALRAVRRK